MIETTAYDAPVATSSTQTARASRRRRKTDAELLDAALAQVEELKAKVDGQRTANRIAVIDELYSHYGIKPIDRDHAEVHRLSQLKARLGLES